MRRWAPLAALLLVAASASAVRAQPRLLDDFSDLAAWKVSATDDVKAALRRVDGPQGRALCIDFDFGHVTGYVTAQRALPLELPPRYEFTMNVRGDAPPNAFQFKLVDASGENVWWGQRPEYRFPHEWQPLKFRQRQIEFAWGPSADHTLRRSATLELVIASGSGAGRGSACFDALTLRRLPDQPSADEPREFGAVTLRWPPGRGASRYDIQFSDDGQQWRTVRHVEDARGDLQHHWLPESEARQVRVLADPAPSVELNDAISANAFFAGVAAQAPRGRYPRAYVGEQSYWTVFGVDGAASAALMSEDGVIEPAAGAGALEPFLVSDGRVVSWADARITHTLRDGDLPMPSTHWRAGDLALDIEAFGDGPPDAARVLARYAVRNLGTQPRPVALALAWRPFQANPPTQFLANPGGASTIDALGWDGRMLSVNGVPRLQPLTAPTGVRLEPAAAGPASAWAAEAMRGRLAQRIDDPAGFANGVLRYEFVLGPGERREVAVAMPIGARPNPPVRQGPGPGSSTAGGPAMGTARAADTANADPDARTIADLARLDVAREADRVAAQWRAKLDRVRITGPAEVQDIARTLRTALGHILVNRSGPALQPGARAYARSWIRDGALTSSALLRLGHEATARDFLRWYAPFQFKNGKVPCCATSRGADPVPENDSDGEFAFAAAELWRYTHDDVTARALWPHVAAAIAHMELLRAGERTAANRGGVRAAYFGLMPPSISHEGYSDKPAYSYWDSFWAATGYRSAVELAQGLGLTDEATRLGAQRDAFIVDLQASVAASAQRFGSALLFGAADRGDVDPTSSTIALSPGGLLGHLPEALVRNTFERYWREFQARRADEALRVRHGDGAYTPYEWRTVGALLRLGERERAHEAMAYFYRDRRPAGWNQWAEVVVHDPREPRFLGDMPHGWVASDQIRSVLDGFAYEHEGEQALVLAAGVKMAWFDGDGVGIAGLRTPYGPLGWQARRAAGGRGPGAIVVDVQGLRSQPPGGITLRGPWGRDAAVWVDGRRVDGPADAIRLAHTPVRVRIEPR